jgi:dTDP-4-amino-4,6-dideoxygalactose transaminase
MSNYVTRRRFINAASTGVAAAGAMAAPATNGRLAILGGAPVRKEKFPSWPRTDALEEKEILAVLKSGRWFRGWGQQVERFEQKYAELLGARHCLATANGTSALFTSLNGVGVAPGDEVIVAPYTFVATVNVILLQHAVPVFVDTDIETFQIDAKKIEAAITDRTTAMIPVHLGGAAADMDAILAIGKKRNIPVIEDACQSHLGEWRGKKVGTLGTTGCFSFQNSKNLNSGEGGAVMTNDAELAERCFAFHSNGRGRKSDGSGFSYRQNGANLRMTEFQAALLMAQMTRLEEQSKTREQNAAYLTALLKEIPGILPAKMYEGCTRNAYHLYMFRYNREAFGGVPRRTFLKALQAEGIPGSGGYSPLNKEPFIRSVLASRAYKALVSPERLKRWEERNQCPANDRLCEEAVWFGQTTLLAAKRDMDQIAEAIRKIQGQAGELRKL